MKKCCVLFLLFLLSQTAEASDRWLAHLEREPLPSLKPPTVREVTLSNGMTCFFLEDHSLPLITVTTYVRAGSVYESFEKRGLVSVLEKLLLRGGSGQRSAQEVDDLIDDYGFDFSSTLEKELGTLTLQMLSEDVDVGLSLFFDVLFRPRFERDRLKVVREQLLESLERQKDNPKWLADTTFFRLVYGAESPWGAEPDAISLQRVRRKDITSFHRNYFVPRNVLCAVAGDFSTEHVLAQLETLTQHLPNDPPQFPKLAPVPYTFEPETKVVSTSLPQAAIRVGHLGIKRDNPDRFSVGMLTHILGSSSFSSRLMKELRTRRGLTYGITSRFVPAADYGVFVIQVTTKNETVTEVLDTIRFHIRTLAEGGSVSSEELDFSRQMFLGRQVFSFDTATEVVKNSIQYRFFGFPDDYWRITQEAIEKLTPADVEKAAKKYLHADGLKVVIVGRDVNP